jgi:hypothetical membrane protein
MLGPRRLAAWGGVAGPVAFVSAWVAGGASRPEYSPVNDAISRLAAIGASSRSLMTAGFVGFGVGLPLYALALREAVPGSAWKVAAGTGLATLGVALAPLDLSPTVDQVHAGVAALGYATLAATPLLAARPLAASGHRRVARISVAAGGVAGVLLAASLFGPAHGALQRAGLTVGDAWVVTSAVWMLSGGVLQPRPAVA